MKYIAIIPARKGSKEIPGKNIKILAGKPLICWTIEQALASKKISKIIVSTDCCKIAKISKESGAEVPFLRPSRYAGDNSSTESVLLHALEYLGIQDPKDLISVILLQPTSPIRFKGSIDKAIEKFEREKADSLVSVNPTKNFFWKKEKNPVPLYTINNRSMRQKLKENEIIYKENGSIYITKLGVLLKKKNRLGGKITFFEMKDEESNEIDSINDFNKVKNLISELSITKKKISISDIQAIIFDFDGVLTDNLVYTSEDGKESVRCNRSDGYSFELIKRLGLKIFILSSEVNSVVEKRAKKLKVKFIKGSRDKLKDLNKICKKHSLQLKKLIYVGNDINDLDVMRNCGFSFAVKDAVAEVKNEADYVLDSIGGGMVAREILDNFLE